MRIVKDKATRAFLERKSRWASAAEEAAERAATSRNSLRHVTVVRVAIGNQPPELVGRESPGEQNASGIDQSESSLSGSRSRSQIRGSQQDLYVVQHHHMLSCLEQTTVFSTFPTRIIDFHFQFYFSY